MIVVENRIPPETLSFELLTAAENGLRGALSSGELGYPVIDVKATLTAAQMQEGISNDIAFTAAAVDSVHKDLRDNMTLLEPIMDVEVTIPEEYLDPLTA